MQPIQRKLKPIAQTGKQIESYSNIREYSDCKVYTPIYKHREISVAKHVSPILEKHVLMFS